MSKKQCSTCGTYKDLLEYSKRSGNRESLFAKCDVCRELAFAKRRVRLKKELNDLNFNKTDSDSIKGEPHI